MFKILFVAVIWALVDSILTAVIAKRKGRNWWVWFMFAMVANVFATLLVAYLPTKVRPVVKV